MRYTAPSKQDDLDFVPLFNQKRTVIYISAKNQAEGIFLPNFDFRDGGPQMASPELHRSWMPYRDRDNTDPETGEPRLLVPFFPVLVWTRLGRKGDNILSPQTKTKLWHPEDDVSVDLTDTADPVTDMACMAATSDNPAWVKLTEEGSEPGQANSKGRALNKKPTWRWLANGFAGTQKKPAPVEAVLCFTNSAKRLVERLMDIARPHAIASPRDPDWPDFLYGDVFNPNRSLMFTTYPCYGQDGGGWAWGGFRFSNTEKTLLGSKPAPVVAEEVLARRVPLYDGRIYNIWSYAKIVEYLENDGLFPLDLIKAACSHRVQVGGTERLGVPNEPKAHRVSRDTTEEPDEIPMSHPPLPAVPSGMSGASGIVTGPDGDFWVAVGGKTVAMTGQQIREGLLDLSLQLPVKAMPKDKSRSWAPLSQLGFTFEPPAVVEDDVPPPPPEDDVPPPPPAEDDAPPPPPVAEGAAAGEAVMASYEAEYKAMSYEQRVSEQAKLISRVQSGVSPSQMQELSDRLAVLSLLMLP